MMEDFSATERKLKLSFSFIDLTWTWSACPSCSAKRNPKLTKANPSGNSACYSSVKIQAKTFKGLLLFFLTNVLFVPEPFSNPEFLCLRIFQLQSSKHMDFCTKVLE